MGWPLEHTHADLLMFRNERFVSILETAAVDKLLKSSKLVVLPAGIIKVFVENDDRTWDEQVT